MIASPLYHQETLEKKGPHSLLKYVTQRSLAVVMFIALAVTASVKNKASDKKESTLGASVSVSLSPDQQRYLSLDSRQLFDNVVRSVKDAFNDPALIEYANEQGIDRYDSLTPPCSNTSQKTEISHSSLNH